MDSALSHSDNCSEIEMEHMKGENSGEEQPQQDHITQYNQQTYPHTTGTNTATTTTGSPPTTKSSNET